MMEHEFQVCLQQRHLKAIVGALRFRQRLLAGYGSASAAIRTGGRPLAQALQSGVKHRRWKNEKD